MWLGNSFRFPYPVLSPTTDDFVNGSLKNEFTISEVIQTGQVEIKYEIEISQGSVNDFVREDDAELGVFVVCPSTYYSRLFKAHLGAGAITIEPGQLRGKVEIRPVVYSSSNGLKIEKYAIHDEFGDQDWVYAKHQFLAIGDLFVVNVGLEKLAPMESIFDLAKDKDLEIGESRVLLEDERVSIIVNPETFNKIHDVRNSPMGQTVLLNSLYLPVVMSILSTLKDGAQHLEQYRWFTVFTAKCDVLGVDVNSDDIFGNAQTLLKLPLKKLVDLKEFRS